MLELVAEKNPHHIILRERVPVEEVEGLFVYASFYDELRRQCNGQDHVYVHVTASGPEGRITVQGISVEEDGPLRGTLHKNITAKVVPFLAQRQDQLEAILAKHNPQTPFHVFVRKPIGKGPETEEYWLGENIVPKYQNPENL
jgi:hypothetical protein